MGRERKKGRLRRKRDDYYGQYKVHEKSWVVIFSYFCCETIVESLQATGNDSILDQLF